jgi:uncharacterized protein YqjF (DUF2071 family)
MVRATMTRWIDKLEQSAAYRQWAPPGREWQAAQAERDIVFMHYAVDYDAVRALVPPVLEVERYDGTAWVGIMALCVAKLHSKHLPIPKPWHHFAEVDLVTYVSHAGRRGVFFLSIESHHRFLALGLRWYTSLPYLYSGLEITGRESLRVTCGPRPSQGAPNAQLDMTYAPTTNTVDVVKGSALDYLLAQYSSFTIDPWGRLAELDEVHAKWKPLEVDLDIRCNTLGQAIGLDLPLQPTMAHAALERRSLTWQPHVVTPNREGLAPPSPPRPPAAPPRPSTPTSSQTAGAE